MARSPTTGIGTVDVKGRRRLLRREAAAREVTANSPKQKSLRSELRVVVIVEEESESAWFRKACSKAISVHGSPSTVWVPRDRTGKSSPRVWFGIPLPSRTVAGSTSRNASSRFRVVVKWPNHARPAEGVLSCRLHHSPFMRV
jgi:hypothetical protein